MQQPTPQIMNITTEQIQKCLDENKELTVAIMENQNLGKLAESASYQTQLQQNLLYLAKIADAQPPQSSTSSQMPPQSVVQQEQHVQSVQAATAKQHPGFLAAKIPFHLNDQQQQPQQPLYIQQQQLNQVQPQVGSRSAAPSGNYKGMQIGVNNFINTQGNKQDGSEDAAGDGFQGAAYGRHQGGDSDAQRNLEQ